MIRSAVRALSILLIATVAGGCGKGNKGKHEPLKVAAAASLVSAFEEIGSAFHNKTGREVVVSAGSSGKLAAQISEGAPFDVFASASEKYVDEVISAKAAAADTKTIYAYGRVAVWTLDDVEPVATIADVAGERFKKIALAQPNHAPYGLAAKQALEAAGVWSQVESRVVYGTNVGQALQFADTGNADVSFTALSLVIRGDKGRYLLIDDAGHAPLSQAVVMVESTNKPEAAKQFIAFLQSDEGRAILRKYGLLQKGESLPGP